MAKRLIVKKVHLDTFIHLLVELYNRGVEFVDIYQMPAESGNDVVGISFTEEYMNENMKNNFKDLSEMADEKEDDDNKPITDDDLNQLI
jgi:hypothetical protein